MATNHPMVVHCIEDHGGEIQPVLSWTLLAHWTPMDRQIQESSNIIEESRKEGSCLNLKSVWAGAKIPGLQVQLPKGVAATPLGRERRKEQESKYDSALDTDTDMEIGIKRLRENAD